MDCRVVDGVLGRLGVNLCSGSRHIPVPNIQSVGTFETKIFREQVYSRETINIPPVGKAGRRPAGGKAASQAGREEG